MGTRSLTRVICGDKHYVNIYRQMDGYPSGHGAELAEFLDNMVIVNGYSPSTPKKAANGAGCLAAQLVAALKDGIGSIYLEPAAETDCNQDYEYIIALVEEPESKDPYDKTYQIMVEVLNYEQRRIFNGTVAEFAVFCGTDPDD